MSEEYYKLQHPGSCTGMFWRKNPVENEAKGDQIGNKDWPKNGAILYGEKLNVKGEDWLKVSKWRQMNSNWINDCNEIWMPFDQGGTLLHSISESKANDVKAGNSKGGFFKRLFHKFK